MNIHISGDPAPRRVPYSQASPVRRRIMAFQLMRAAVFEIARAVELASYQEGGAVGGWFTKIAHRLDACAASFPGQH